MRRPFSLGLGMLLVASTLATGLPAAVAAPPPGGNLVSDGGFEAGHSRWRTGPQAKLGRTADGHSGRRAARVTNAGRTAATTVLNDAVNTVRSTTAGATYEATVWVRSSRPGVTVNLRLMEFAGVRTLRGQVNASRWLRDRAWHRLTVRRTVGGGNNLDLNVMAWKLPVGSSFDVDDVSLVRLPTSVAEPAPAGKPAQPSGWRQVWADEFDGSVLDRARWTPENASTYGDGNGELACLTSRPENVSVSGGLLALTARREPAPYRCGSRDGRFPAGRSFTSGHLTTKATAAFTYGRFEIRAKLPTTPGSSKGLWPAFWLRPVDGGIGEIDVLEAVGGSDPTAPSRVSQTLHYDYKPTFPHQARSHRMPADAAADFHTYAVEWEPGAIRWYVDGHLTYTRDRTTTPWLTEAFSRPFYLRLNLAVGGSWPGAPDANTDFGAAYLVDYVRAYAR